MKSLQKLFQSTLIFLFITIIACQTKTEKTPLIVPEGKIGLIGYGSLTSKENVMDQLGHPYHDSLYYVHLNGFIREWNFVGSNMDPNLPKELLEYDSYYLHGEDTLPFQQSIFLNIMSDSSQKINCVLYFIDESELTEIDKMEIGYNRIEVSSSIIEYAISGGPVYAYKAKPSYEYHTETDSLNSIIDLAYAELVFDAYDRLGKEARKEFDTSTKPFAPHLLAPVIRLKRK
ncbi:MAG: hypothetical protein NXI00_10020 [Cytophagales bacterium]|nr:hypothetical protein [Cytophagales bacterium]